MNDYQLVRDWMIKFKRDVDKTGNYKDFQLCSSIIEEEFEEVDDELNRWREDGKPTSYFEAENLTKELCDLIWVCHFTAAKFGLPIEKAFKRVYESNMSKLDNDGNPVLREDGKILKSDNYKPADLSDLF